MGNELKNKILEHNGIITEEMGKKKPSVLHCPRCDLINVLENKYCSKCSYPLKPEAFLKYYWHQICKYKIKQNCHTDKLPLIVQIIHEFFGTQYIPESFESMPKDRVAASEKMIAKN